MLILHETYDHWSVAVLTVTEHFTYSHFWFFFQIGCFLHWIQSVYPHLLCSLYDNGSPLYLWSPSGLLCWWILVVLEVVLNLVCLPISSGLAALMRVNIAQNYDHWSVAFLTVTEHFIYSHFSFFFKLVAFCTELNLFNPICLVIIQIMDLQYICDHQVGYTAGEYSLSPRLFLTWYIYQFSEDTLNWWVLILHKTYDHWSVAVWTVIEHFIYSHFWFFFSNWLLSALN